MPADLADGRPNGQENVDNAPKPTNTAGKSADGYKLVKALLKAGRTKALGDKLFARLQGPGREEAFRELNLPPCSRRELDVAYEQCSNIWKKFLDREADTLVQYILQECDSMMEADRKFREFSDKVGKKLKDQVTLSPENLRLARARCQAYWSNITPGNVALIVNNLAGKCPSWDSAEKKFDWVWKKGEWREDKKAVRFHNREFSIQDLEEAERRCRQRFGLPAIASKREPGSTRAPAAAKAAPPPQAPVPAVSTTAGAGATAAPGSGDAVASDAATTASSAPAVPVAEAAPPGEAAQSKAAASETTAESRAAPARSSTAATAPRTAKGAPDAPVAAAQPAVMPEIALKAVTAAFSSGASSKECAAIAEVAAELEALTSGALDPTVSEPAAPEGDDNSSEIAKVRAEIEMLKGTSSEPAAPTAEADAAASTTADAPAAAAEGNAEATGEGTAEATGEGTAESAASGAGEAPVQKKPKEEPMSNEEYLTNSILKKCSDMESAHKFFKWIREKGKKGERIKDRIFTKADIEGAEKRCREVWGIKDEVKKEEEEELKKGDVKTEQSAGVKMPDPSESNVEVIVQQVLKKCNSMSETEKYWELLSRGVGKENPMGRVFTMEDIDQAKQQVSDFMEAAGMGVKDEDTLASLAAPRKRGRDAKAKKKDDNKGKSNADLIVKHVLLNCKNMDKASRIFDELNATIGQMTSLGRIFLEEDIAEAYFICGDKFEKLAQESSGSSDDSDSSSDSSSSAPAKRQKQSKTKTKDQKQKKKEKKEKRKRKAGYMDELGEALFSESEDSLSGEEDVDEEDENASAALLADLGLDEGDEPADLDDEYPVEAWEATDTKINPGDNGFNQRATDVMASMKVGAGKMQEIFDKEAACPPLQPHQDTVAFLMHPRSPIKKLLVDHPTGSGKTREMIKVLDNFFHDSRPKVPIFPKDPVCRNFYAELLRWPSRYRDYFCCERPADAALASNAPNWREHRFHMWDLSSFREDEVRRLCFSMREVLEMKGMFLRGMVRRSCRQAFYKKNPGERMPMAPLRALGYTSAGGSFSSIIEDKPQSAIMKIGYKKGSNNVYHNKIVLMDEAHNLVRTQTQYAEQLFRLRDLLHSADNLILAGFTGTPILNEPTEGRQLLDIIKGINAPDGDEGFLSSFPFRPQPLFPVSLPRGIPDGVLTAQRKRQLLQKVEIHGETLRVYDWKRRTGIPSRRLRAYCNVCTFHGSFHDGKHGTKVKVLTFPEDCCPKLLAIANAVASSTEKAVIMTSRQSGYIVMLELMRFIAMKQEEPFQVATMDELSEFNHVSNLRGEVFRVLVADATQCSEGVSFLAVRRTFLADVPVSPSQFIQQCGRAIRMYGHRGLPEEEQTVTNSLYVAIFPKWMRSSLACWALRAQKKHVSGKDTEKKARLLTARLNRAGIRTLSELKSRIDSFGADKFASQALQSPEEGQTAPDAAEKVQLTAEDVVGFLEQNGLWEEAKLLRVADKKEREKAEATSETRNALMRAVETQAGLAPGGLAALTSTVSADSSTLARSDTLASLDSAALARADTLQSLGDSSLGREDTLQSLDGDMPSDKPADAPGGPPGEADGLDDLAAALEDVLDAADAGAGGASDAAGGSNLEKTADEAAAAVTDAVNGPHFEAALAHSDATGGDWLSRKLSDTVPAVSTAAASNDVKDDEAMGAEEVAAPAEIQATEAIAAPSENQAAEARMDVDDDSKAKGDDDEPAKEKEAAVLGRAATFLRNLCEQISKAGLKTKQEKKHSELAATKAVAPSPEERGRTPSPEPPTPLKAEPAAPSGDVTADAVEGSAEAAAKGPTPSPSPESGEGEPNGKVEGGEGEDAPKPSPDGEDAPKPSPDSEDAPRPSPESEDAPKPSPESENAPKPSPENEFNELSVNDKAIAAAKADAEWRRALREGMAELRENAVVLAALRSVAPGFEEDGDIQDLTAEQVRNLRDEIVRLDKEACATQALAAVQVALQEIEALPEGAFPSEACRRKLESGLSEVRRNEQVEAAIKAAGIFGPIIGATITQVKTLREELIKAKVQADLPQAKPRALVRAVQALYTAVSLEDATRSLEPETADEEALRTLTERSSEFAPALSSMRAIAVDHEVFQHLADQSDDEKDLGEEVESEESDVGKDLIGKREPAPVVLPPGWHMEWVRRGRREMRQFVDPIGTRYLNVNQVRAALEAWEARGGPPEPEEEEPEGDDPGGSLNDGAPEPKKMRLTGKTKSAGSGYELPPSLLDFEGHGESLEDAFGEMLDLDSLGTAAASSASQKAEAESMELGPGKRVKLHGLMAKPELNGQFARVVKLIQESGRWECWLLSGSQNEKVNVKAANLEVVPELKQVPQQASAKGKGRGKATGSAAAKRALSASAAPAKGSSPVAKRGRGMGGGKGAAAAAPAGRGAAAAKAAPESGRGRGKGRGRSASKAPAQVDGGGDGGSESD